MKKGLSKIACRAVRRWSRVQPLCRRRHLSPWRPTNLWMHEQPPVDPELLTWCYDPLMR